MADTGAPAAADRRQLGLAVRRRLPRNGQRDVLPPPAERAKGRRARIQAAKAVCTNCPVMAQCLDHALAVREPYGMWGGCSEDERAKMLGLQSLRYPARIRAEVKEPARRRAEPGGVRRGG